MLLPVGLVLREMLGAVLLDDLDAAREVVRLLARARIELIVGDIAGAVLVEVVAALLRDLGLADLHATAEFQGLRHRLLALFVGAFCVDEAVVTLAPRLGIFAEAHALPDLGVLGVVVGSAGLLELVVAVPDGTVKAFGIRALKGRGDLVYF